MRSWLVVLLAAATLGAPLLAACSGGALPDGACRASDPACLPASHADASVTADGGGEASPSADGGADGTADAAPTCVGLVVDDAGVTHGCTAGGMGPGDRDDGGGAPAPPPPDAALDAGDLPFGASCWDNAQCASGVCFDYKVRGTFCTQPCSASVACPAESPGCNGMGVCRLPAPPDGG